MLVLLSVQCAGSAGESRPWQVLWGHLRRAAFPLSRGAIRPGTRNARSEEEKISQDDDHDHHHSRDSSSQLESARLTLILKALARSRQPRTGAVGTAKTTP